MTTQGDNALTTAGDAPIYARLVEERGDVPAEVRRTAEQTLSAAAQAVNFRSVRAKAA